jgi:Ras family protein
MSFASKRALRIALYSPAGAHNLPFLPSKPHELTYSQGADTVPLTIVGNKSDLRPEQRQVTLADGKKLAEELGCGFTEASARYNENVGKAFEGMIAEIEKGQEAGQPKEGNAKCAVM